MLGDVMALIAVLTHHAIETRHTNRERSTQSAKNITMLEHQLLTNDGKSPCTVWEEEQATKVRVYEGGKPTQSANHVATK